MTPQKFQKAEQSLNGAARSVFSHVSAQQAMTASEIVGAMRRAGINTGVDVALACLATLRDAGLVREPKPKTYMRVIPRQPIHVVSGGVGPVRMLEPDDDDEDTNDMKTGNAGPLPQAVATAERPMDRLGIAAAALRKMAEDLLRTADEIDAAAVAYEAAVEKATADTANLRQLKELLKGLGS